MANDLVDALPELRVLLFEEVRLDPAVAGPPGLAVVVGAVDAAGRGRDGEPVAARRIRQDGVKAEPAAPRRPLRPVRVVPEAFVQRPALSSVAGFEQSGGLDADEDLLGLVVETGLDLPDVRKGGARLLRERDARDLRAAPLRAKVVARAELGAPVETLRRRPDPMAIVAPVVADRVDRASGKVRSAPFPPAPRAVGLQKEGAFHRADEQEDVAVPDGDFFRGHDLYPNR